MLGRIQGVPHGVGLGWGLITGISNRYTGGADAAGLGPHSEHSWAGAEIASLLPAPSGVV